MHSGRKTVEHTPILPLSLTGPGTYEVTEIRSGSELTRKLLCLGIQPGQHIDLLNEDCRGPLMIGLAGNRLALGRGLAHNIMVRQVRDARCMV
ncbi:MAG TPA: ferrous iron transport protein A [Atribacteraceae bacterium]|nr:ferrous iron transport protein A [Atribacteraceae bacterium]